MHNNFRAGITNLGVLCIRSSFRRILLSRAELIGLEIPQGPCFTSVFGNLILHVNGYPFACLSKYDMFCLV